MPSAATHDLQWDEQLLEWLDGTAAVLPNGEFAQHLQHCVRCRQRAAEFRTLDLRLRRSIPPLMLDAAFDNKLLEQIIRMDQTASATAQCSGEREAAVVLGRLARRWRRSVLLVVPGTFSAVVTAGLLAQWLTGSAWLRDSLQVSGGNGGILLSAVLGASVGGALSGWLASLIE